MQVNAVENLVKGMADGKVDAKAGDEKTLKVLERQRELERARALKKEADARSAAAAAKKKIVDDHRSKWGFYGMWCVRCRAEKQIDAKACDKCKSDLIDPETRQKQLLARVEEVKAERIARDIARDRWKRWKVVGTPAASVLLQCTAARPTPQQASKQYIRYGHTAEHYGKVTSTASAPARLPPPIICQLLVCSGTSSMTATTRTRSCPPRRRLRHQSSRRWRKTCVYSGLCSFAHCNSRLAATSGRKTDVSGAPLRTSCSSRATPRSSRGT